MEASTCRTGSGRLAALLAAVGLAWGAGASAARADTLWDNDLAPDGVSSISTYPTLAAEDFQVPEPGWRAQDFHVAIVEADGWVFSGTMEVTIYSGDGGGSPGPVFAQFDAAYTRTATGQTVFGKDVYEYGAGFDDVVLPAGDYFIGWRDLLDNGWDAAWLTSTGGAHGDTLVWRNDGAGWYAGKEDLAFEITGVVVPEPATLPLLALGAVAATRRRRSA